MVQLILAFQDVFRKTLDFDIQTYVFHSVAVTDQQVEFYTVVLCYKICDTVMFYIAPYETHFGQNYLPFVPCNFKLYVICLKAVSYDLKY